MTIYRKEFLNVIYLQEICRFPSSKHNDQVDSTSQALEWMNKTAHWGDQFRISVL